MPVANTRPQRRFVAALRAALVHVPNGRSLLDEIEYEPTDVSPQKPDLFWRHRRSGVAVYIDGCAWHGCKLHGRRHEREGHGLSSYEITRRQLADRRGREALAANGVSVVAIWEHEIKEDVGACVRRVLMTLGAPLPARPSSPRARRAG